MSPSGVDRVLVEAMRDTMSHRGPDDCGTWIGASGTVVLAHRRLSVIDLSPDGRQPMTDPSGRFTIIFNGEIYNFGIIKESLIALGYSFRSRSDTEVLLNAYAEWGEDCLGKIDGMFVMCIFDAHKNTLFLARDRAGEKPLFYHHVGREFSFSSELKGLLADPAIPRAIDHVGLNFYLAYGYVCGEQSLLSGVKKLPAGHFLTFKTGSGEFALKQYWSVDNIKPDFSEDPHELTSQFFELLKKSVSRTLTADVPVGVLLSGGVDSSLVTAAAACCSSSPIMTFTVSFPGFDCFDEGPYARLVADYFSTEHIELRADDVSVELLPKLARQYDEPLGDSSMVPMALVCELIRKHAVVAVGGDGGDELFGGYPHHRWGQRFSRWGRFCPFKRMTKSVVERILPVGTPKRNPLFALLSSSSMGMTQFGLFFSPQERKRLLGDWGLAIEICQPESYKYATQILNGSDLQKLTTMDFKTYLCDDILVKVDRASMLASLEVRAPLLSREMIEFAFSRVPDKLRSTESQTKILPKMLARTVLPQQLDINRKQGFSVPLNSWLKNEWGEFCFDVLRSVPKGFLDPAEIKRLIELQKAGFNNGQRIFALVMLELWRREYSIEI